MQNLHMRRSRVLDKLRAGEVVNCFKMNFTCPRVSEMAAMSGYDCVWIDMEHVPCDWSTVEGQLMAAKMHGTDSLVRVSRGGYSDYIRPLEMDAAGIMVPHIMSADDARQVVRMTRFHPVGMRPIDGGNADGRYCSLPLGDYVKQANENRFLCLQIEDVEPLDDLDEICAMEGVDIIFFGPGDFSQSIGAAGQWDDPRIDEARRRVVAAALAHGKFAGTPASPETLPGLIEMGYRFFSLGADVVAMADYCRGLLETFDKAAAVVKA